jgi:hypothetical protein
MSTPTPADAAEQLAAVLSVHQRTTGMAVTSGWTCRCGEWMPGRRGERAEDHQAAEVLKIVQGWGSAVTTPEPVADAIETAEDAAEDLYAQHGSSHFSCCYSASDAREVARAAVTALAAAGMLRPPPAGAAVPAPADTDASPALVSADTKYLCPTHWASYLEGHSWWDEKCTSCDHVRARRILGNEAPAYGKRVFVVDARSGMRTVARHPEGPVRHQFRITPAPASPAGGGDTEDQAGRLWDTTGRPCECPTPDPTRDGQRCLTCRRTVEPVDTATEERELREDETHHATFRPKLAGGAADA